MVYKVIITEDAETDLDNFIQYLIFVKRIEQAAKNFLDDFEATKNSLSASAGSLKDCTNTRLKKLGYKRINFRSHECFMLYRIENDIAIVDNIFHNLQNYKNLMF